MRETLQMRNFLEAQSFKEINPLLRVLPLSASNYWILHPSEGKKGGKKEGQVQLQLKNIIMALQSNSPALILGSQCITAMLAYQNKVPKMHLKLWFCKEQSCTGAAVTA